VAARSGLVWLRAAPDPNKLDLTATTNLLKVSRRVRLGNVKIHQGGGVRPKISPPLIYALCLEKTTRTGSVVFLLDRGRGVLGAWVHNLSEICKRVSEKTSYRKPGVSEKLGFPGIF
jgi:hypothetical protein